MEFAANTLDDHFGPSPVVALKIEIRFHFLKVIQWASGCISGNRYYDGPFP